MRFVGLDAEIRRCRAIGHAYLARGDVQRALQQMSNLTNLQIKFTEDLRHFQSGHAFCSVDPEKTRRQLCQSALLCKQAVNELLIHHALVQGDRKWLSEALAKDPTLEPWQRALLELAWDREQSAREAMQVGLRQTPRRPATLIRGIEFFRRIQDNAQADALLAQLRNSLAPEDWTLPSSRRWAGDASSPDDLGTSAAIEMPDATSLRRAPKLVLPDRTGRLLSLQQGRRGAVLVVFFLGAGCPHCLEQLNLLAPAKDEFAQSGISMLAVSTDSVEGLAAMYKIDGAEQALPFPVVSDEPLDRFRAFGAYDEFQRQPLHGLFLIDPDGRICWRAIGVEPFMAIRFLLTESQRLLKTPPEQIAQHAWPAPIN